MLRTYEHPQPGYLKMRLRRGAPFVPARIRRLCHCTIGGSVAHDWRPACDRFPMLVGELRGEPVEDIDWLWTSGRPITEAEWRALHAAPAVADLRQARIF